MDKFINLHTHDEYSNIRLKDSINRIPQMIDYVANTLGQKGFAITNHDCLSNHVKYINTVKEMKKEGKIPQDFKYILGNEVYLLDEYEMNDQLENKKYVPFYHFVLNAIDSVGHEQLQQISSLAWGRAFNYRGMDRVPTFYTDIENVIGEDKGHIVASTACLGGRLPKQALKIAQMEQCLSEGRYLNSFTKEWVQVEPSVANETIAESKQDIHQFLSWCVEMFGDNFYIELQPSSQDDQIMANKVLKRIAQAYNIPCIVTTDAHYLNADYKEFHKAFLKSDEDDETYNSGGRETDDFYDSTYFMGSEEIHSRLDYLGQDFVQECIDNTYNIYEQAEQYDLYINQVVPEVPLPERSSWNYDEEFINEVYNNHQDFPSIIELISSDNPYDNYLVYLINLGLKNKGIMQGDYDEYYETLKRINTECGEIIGISKEKNAIMSSYFITMNKFIDIIWDEAESLIGVSRGSAAGFMVNYLLGITQINPLKQPVEMPHWRFVTAQRPDYPKH